MFSRFGIYFGIAGTAARIERFAACSWLNSFVARLSGENGINCVGTKLSEQQFLSFCSIEVSEIEDFKKNILPGFYVAWCINLIFFA